MLGSVGEPDGRPGARARRAFLVLLVGGLVTIAHAAAAGEPDTLWYGGVDPVTGLAVEGGVWDFEDCTPQGWTSRDLTAIGPFFHHVTAETTAAHGDPMATVITANGSMGSIWCGVHEDDARAACWPGGMGYSNYWRQLFRKSFTYAGSGEVVLELDYFVDSERALDEVLMFVSHSAGSLVGPLNTSASIPGYSGSLQQGNAIGSPPFPAHDEIVIAETSLPAPGEPFEIIFRVTSDLVFSDGRDWAAPVLDTRGVFGVDNIIVTGDALRDTSDFEPTGVDGQELDGWTAAPDSVGAFMRVVPLSELDPPTDPCDLAGCILAASDSVGPEHHPRGMLERLVSNVVPVPTGFVDIVLEYDANLDFSTSAELVFSVRAHFYPWTCPTTGTVDWTPHPFLVQRVNGSTPCERVVHDLSDVVPATAESVRVVIDVLRECHGCPPQITTGDAPYWDNLRVGFSPPVVGIPPGATTSTPSLQAPAILTPGSQIVVRAEEPGASRLHLLDVAGRVVATLFDEHLQLERRIVQWAGKSSREIRVAAGVYFLYLRTPAGAATRRVVVLE